MSLKKLNKTQKSAVEAIDGTGSIGVEMFLTKNNEFSLINKGARH